MSKGIITIAMGLLSAALLLFAAGIAYQSSMGKETSHELEAIDAARQQYDSAASAISSLARHGAVNITVAGNNLSMRTNLTLLAGYQRDLVRLRNFIYGNAEPGTSMDISEAINPTIHVRPQGIAMAYAANRLTITPQDTPASAGNLTGYTITLTFNQSTPAFNWSIISPGTVL